MATASLSVQSKCQEDQVAQIGCQSGLFSPVISQCMVDLRNRYSSTQKRLGHDDVQLSRTRARMCLCMRSWHRGVGSAYPRRVAAGLQVRFDV